MQSFLKSVPQYNGYTRLDYTSQKVLYKNKLIKYITKPCCELTTHQTKIRVFLKLVCLHSNLLLLHVTITE